MKVSNRLFIAHVIFRLDFGGLENGLVNLINGLSKSRFRHAVICIDDFSEFKDRIRRDDVELIAIHKRPGTDLSALRRLYRVFRDLRPDVVHTRNLPALDALLPAFLAGVRVRIHGEHGWDVNDLRGQNMRTRLLRKIHSPFVNHYVALSKNIERYLVNKIGVKPERISQLYNGVDAKRFRPSRQMSSERRQIFRNLGSDLILIGSVGRMQAVKDPLTLVDSFIQFARKNPGLVSKVRLVMIGDGPLREAVIAKIDEAKLSDAAWIPGARNDVAEIMRCLDVYVQPSLAEGISNTILEAMASGLPVIATEVGGNVELVSDGLTGTVVGAGDVAAIANGIEHYVLNPELRLSHGACGRARVEEAFGITEMLRNYARMYELVANKHGANSSGSWATGDRDA